MKLNYFFVLDEMQTDKEVKTFNQRIQNFIKRQM